MNIIYLPKTKAFVNFDHVTKVVITEKYAAIYFSHENSIATQTPEEKEQVIRFLNSKSS